MTTAMLCLKWHSQDTTSAWQREKNVASVFARIGILKGGLKVAIPTKVVNLRLSLLICLSSLNDHPNETDQSGMLQ